MSKDAKAERRKALDEAIYAAGGMTALSKELNIKKDAVQKWRLRGIPAVWCKTLEAMTGVSRKRLRPDIFG